MAWLLAMGGVALAGRSAYLLQGHPHVSLPLLASGVVHAVALWGSGRDSSPVASAPASSPNRRLRFAAAAIVFIVAMAASFVVRDALSSMVAPDSNTYWATPGDFLQKTPGMKPIRTPQYSLLFVGAQMLGGKGAAVLFLQFALRAVSAALIAWLLSRWSLLAGLVVGGLLAADPVSAATSAAYLTESLYTSALMLATIIAIAQLTGHPSWRRWPLVVAAGFAMGAALLVRPSSIALLGIIVPIYGLATRSAVSAIAVGAGYALSCLMIAVFNYFKSGIFVVVTTGLYVAFPLFLHQLMDPKNGPASETITRQLAACHPTFDYRSVHLEIANEFVFTKLLPCTLKANGNDLGKAYELYGRAYREAFLAHPVVFTWRLSLESLRFLAMTVSDYTNEVAEYNHYVMVQGACEQPPRPPFAAYLPKLLEFICPISPTDPAGASRLVAGTALVRLLYQPYLYVYDPRVVLHSPENKRVPELTGAAALLFLALAIGVARPAYRPLILAAAAVILSNAAITALGQVTLRRYVAPLSPFFLIVSGLLLVSMIEDGMSFLRRVARFGRRAGATTGAA